MMRRLHKFGTTVLLTFAIASSASAGSLRGSQASMRAQHKVAEKSRLTFVATDAQLRQLVGDHRLEPVTPSAELRFENVSYPYARPMTVLFLERLAADYRAAMGEALVVTSLTRPLSLQPRNSSPLSVHPAGIAVDLRIPTSATGRQWLERELLALETKGVLDVTRERSPAHYHVAVYPEKYVTYAAGLPPVVHYVAPAPVVVAMTPEPELSGDDWTRTVPAIPVFALFAIFALATTARSVSRMKHRESERTAAI